MHGKTSLGLPGHWPLAADNTRAQMASSFGAKDRGVSSCSTAGAPFWTPNATAGPRPRRAPDESASHPWPPGATSTQRPPLRK
eukprot:1831487-Pyramimonas_sp.AAC.1